MTALRLALAVFCFAALALPAQGQPPPGRVGSFMAEAGPVAMYRVADRLDRPWGMTFLTDGRMLVTERPGRLRIVDGSGEMPATVSGTPTVYAQGQGGLLDVALDPDFAETGYVYLSYARPGPRGTAATALGRGRLVDDALEDFEVLFTQEPYESGSAHFGSRIAFSPDGAYLFLAMGERFKFDPAQDLGSHLGTIIRIRPDGSIPDDNPFVGRDGAQPEIWSYGHRNIESAAFDPATGELYVVEMGPLGGDELNRIERGANYGWPEVSWGIDYDGEDIPDPTTRPEFEDAVTWWSPVIAPSGMAYYDGDAFPAWQGNALVGSLKRQGLVRLAMADGEVVEEEVLPMGRRIREVEVGPDGFIYVLTDQANGDVLRLEPIEITQPED